MITCSPVSLKYVYVTIYTVIFEGLMFCKLQLGKGLCSFIFLRFIYILPMDCILIKEK